MRDARRDAMTRSLLPLSLLALLALGVGCSGSGSGATKAGGALTGDGEIAGAPSEEDAFSAGAMADTPSASTSVGKASGGQGGIQARDRAILAARHIVYASAKTRNPRRWTGSTRNWTPIRAVRLNPEKREACSMH
jgi:hypothetical protein